MCTLAIYFRTIPGYPVVIAANRDEFLARPAVPPTTLCDKPHIVGGKDLKAGGTWLGINEHGLIAGLLNRRMNTGADAITNPELRSRGLLCLDALGCSSVNEAAELVTHERGSSYNGFNLLVASGDAAFVAYNRGAAIDVQRLTPGLHLLTNLDVDDFECPKISRSYRRFDGLARDESFRHAPIELRARLGELLADHSTQLDPRSGAPNSLCLHHDGYGTRSSSLIFLDDRDGQVTHFFAPGPPCETPYAPAAVPRHSSR